MRITTLFTAILILTISCQNNDDTKINSLEDYSSSYALIQAEIWDASCTNCHMAGTSFANQSNLVLTSDVSYEQLVNREANNQAAKEDGLLLVGDKGLESLYKSFLWEKINVPDQEHFYAEHSQYGSLMPLGGDGLTNGQLEFIRQWILSGAPKEGNVVDLAVLADESIFETVEFAPLDIPEQGLQFHLEPFEIQPNRNREFFVYKELNNPEPIYIHSVEIIMRPGSHHFIFYNFPDSFLKTLYPSPELVRDIYNSDGSQNLLVMYHMQYHQFITGTQWPRTHYTFPEGVALKLPANSGFDLNSHYVNSTDEVMIGEVYANIYTVNESEVVKEAQILNLNNIDFLLPAGKTTTITETFTFQEERNVFQLWSHAHEHMTQFNVYIDGGDRNGELIYVSYDWEHPPILQLDPPLLLNAGEGLKLETTYNNDEDHDLKFGLKNSDEMMILFGAYY
ncbi:MAG: hypothetical protein ACJA08_000061 [Cyclobacteriaceae bacterium]|jgi:hypothetical protein